MTRLQRVAGWVPDDVEVGFHLCYGSYQDEHFIEPETTVLMVQVAIATLAGLRRPVSWIHIPVPIGRLDDEYFAPLRSLASASRLEEVYLAAYFTAKMGFRARWPERRWPRSICRTLGSAANAGLAGSRPKPSPG